MNKKKREAAQQFTYAIEALDCPEKIGKRKQPTPISEKIQDVNIRA